MKSVKYTDLEEIFYRLQLTYDENVNILDKNYIAGSTVGYTLVPRIYEISDFNLMIAALFPNKVKANATIDDI